MGKPRAVNTTALEPMGTPFCRRVELARICSLLEGTEGQAVLLEADMGLGATTLLAAVAEWAAQRAPVLEIRATPALQSMAFGSLHAAAGAGAPYASLVPVEMYRALFAHFAGSRGAHGPSGSATDALPLIIIDCAEVLDKESAALVSDMVRSGSARAVIATSSSQPLPEPLPGLWRNGLAERITLQPLDREAAHEYCQGVLGATMLAASSANICRTAAGNPLLMRHMIVEGRAAGKLIQSNGVWIMDPLFRPEGTRLGELVQEHLRGLTLQERNALDLVAFAEPVEESDLALAVGPQTVQSLRAQKWLVDPPNEPGHVRLANPLYGQALRALVPKTRSRMLHRQLQRPARRHTANPEALLRQTLWSLESAEHVPDGQLVRAAIHACRLFQADTAARLADAIQGQDSAGWAACIKARAKFLAGDYVGAVHSLPDGTDGDGSLEELLRAPLLRELLRASLGHSTGLSRADAAALREAGASLALTDPGRKEEIIRRTAEMASLVELLALSREGHYLEMQAPLGRLLDAGHLGQEPESAMKHAVALALDAERLTALGQPVLAAEQARAALMAQGEQGALALFLPELVVSRAHTAAVAAGNWNGVEELLISTGMDGGRSTIGYDGSGSLGRGLVLLRQGRAGEALDVLGIGVESLAVQDPAQLFGFCTSLAYFAAARLGREKIAERYALMQQRGSGMYLVSSHEAAFMAAGREHLLGDGAGLAQLMHLADAAHARGLPTVELNALVLALDFAPDDGGDRLLAVAGAVQGEWGNAMALYARAVAGSRAEEQLSAAQQLARGQMNQHAAHLFVRAEATALAKKKGTLARVARAGATRSLQAMGQVRESAELLRIKQAASIELTRREQEIVTMAARGLSDPDIAARLQLSVRTIEGHLYHSYAKLNIASRMELKGALLQRQSKA